MKYRKKPIVVEAYQIKSVQDILHNKDEWPQWLKDAWKKELHEDGSMSAFKRPQAERTSLLINNHSGTVFVRDGDWIIKGIEGEFYSCKPDIFEATYEKVEG